MSAAVVSERRHRRRYPLRFELEYRVFGKGHAIVAGKARTANMSSEGILLTPTVGITRGQLVELSIHWQTAGDTGPKADLEILGRVLRVDSIGTAVRILRYGFYPQAAHIVRNGAI